MAQDKRDIRIHTSREIDVGHFIPDDDGMCKNLHGHRLKVEVDITGPVQKDGMVWNFKDIKKIIDSMDHKTIIPTKSPHLEIIEAHQYYPGQERNIAVKDTKNNRVYAIPETSIIAVHTTHSTAEVLAELFKDTIMVRTGLDPENIKVRVWETPKSYAETV